MLCGAALIAVACVTVACESRTSTPLGGEWRAEKVSGSGLEQGFTRYELWRGKDLVDDEVPKENITFLEPDCVVYATKRVNRPMFAVCGARVPLSLPAWAMDADQTGLWGGYITKSNGAELWEMVPIADVLDAARRQPAFVSNWRDQSYPALQVEQRLVTTPPARYAK